ncbi:MAG: 30S ribosomal protein S16 [Candidatus Omnitrophota bacterium]
MEVCIRMQRIGKSINKVANYRVIVIAKPKSRDSKTLEILGYYDPTKKPASFSINQEKLGQWIKKGAVMSDTVKTLVKKINKK